MIDPDDEDERYFVGSGFSSFKTKAEFDEQHYELEQQAIAVTMGKQIGRSWSVTLAIGLVLGGELEDHEAGRDFDIDEGMMLNLQLIRQLDFGARDEWFVAGELGAGMAIASSAERIGGEELGNERVQGYDLRAGVLAGRRVADIVRPFVLARGYLGPMRWRIDGDEVGGTEDTYYQVGAGINVDVPLGFTVGVEGGFLGERRLAVGVATKL